MGRAGWGASLTEDKAPSGMQDSFAAAVADLRVPGDNEPTREILSMMNVDKDREARRGIPERIPMTHVYFGSLPDDTESHHHCTTEIAEDAVLKRTTQGRPEKAKAPKGG